MVNCTDSILRNDIQGLRALSVLAVIAFHANNNWLPGGFIGVDVFFVISGYLICGVICRQREQGYFTFVRFYKARLLRIFPAYFLMLGVTALVMSVLLIPKDLNSFIDSLYSASYFNSNNFFASQHDYFAPQSYELALLHTWSLAVEMQFYVLLPLALLFVPRRFVAQGFALTVLCLFFLSEYQLSQIGHQPIYFSLVARIPEFLVGALVALPECHTRFKRTTQNVIASIGLLFLFGSFWLITHKDPFPGLLAIPACAGAALLIVSRDSFVNRCLSHNWLVLIGGLSYSLYLWHWPVLSAFRYYFQRYELPLFALGLALFFTSCLAYVSQRWVELPFRRQSKIGRTNNLFKLSAVVTVLFLVTGTAQLWNGNLVPALRSELTRYEAPQAICHGKTLKHCMRGDLNATKTILLIGDSHAAQLNHFSDVVGQRIGVKFEVLTASSCIPFRGFDIERIRAWAHDACLKQIAEVEPRLLKADGVLIAGMWSYHDDSKVFKKAFSRFIQWLDANEVPTLILGQVPMFDGSIQRLTRFEALGLSSEVKKETAWQHGNENIRSIVDQYANAQFLDLSSLPLFENAPFFQGNAIYFDEHHLNEVGSKVYGRQSSQMILSWVNSRL